MCVCVKSLHPIVKWQESNCAGRLTNFRCVEFKENGISNFSLI